MGSLPQEVDVIEKLLNHIGTNGKFQKRFNILFNIVFINMFALSAFNIILALSVPRHWCHVPGRNETNLTIEQWKDLTLPRNDDGYSFSKCKMYSANATGAHHNGTSRYVTECQHGWEYDTTWYELTAPAQENWVCNRELYVTNALFFARAGEAIGSLIFGHLGDTIGRRPVMFIAVATLVTGRIMSVLTSGTYYLFLASCFIGNAPAVTVFVAPLIIAVEMSSKEKRAEISMFQCLAWTGGTCLVPIVAWITGGEWKTFLVVSTLPSLAVFLFQRIFPESPRWLASRGKYEQCEKVLRQISNVNGKVLTQDALRLLQKTDQKKDTAFGIRSLFSSWRLAKNTCLVSSCVVLCHLIAYSLVLLVTSMSGNPYLNFLLQASAELPAFVVGRFLCDRVGRRLTQSTAYILVGISLTVLSIVLNVSSLQWLPTALVVFTKFLITVTIYVSYLLNTEMYPICVRQTASSVSFVTSGTVGVLAPYIAYLGTAVDIRYPYMILASLSILGATCSLFLPETLNQKLPENLSDAAYFGSDQKFWNFPICSYSKEPRPEELVQEEC